MNTRAIVLMISVGLGMAFAPLVVTVSQETRIAGMAVVLGVVAALMMRDIMDRRKR